MLGERRPHDTRSPAARAVLNLGAVWMPFIVASFNLTQLARGLWRTASCPFLRLGTVRPQHACVCMCACLPVAQVLFSSHHTLHDYPTDESFPDLGPGMLSLEGFLQECKVGSLTHWH